jgi:hypothetical protein
MNSCNGINGARAIYQLFEETPQYKNVEAKESN